MSNNEMNNNAMEPQVEINDIPEVAEVQPKESVNAKKNKEIASTLLKQNPELAKEILKKRLANMTPEQIAALRAAKAKAEEEKAAKEAEMAAAAAAVEAADEKVEDAPMAEAAGVAVPPVESVATEEMPVVAAPAPEKAPSKKSRKKRSMISYESRQAFTGFMFVLPWFIGFLLFFAIPCFQSLQFSFSKVEVFNNYACTWVGLGNYYDILTGGATFLQALINTLGDLAVNVPVILIFSLFVAVLLNRKFIGRGMVRAIFFLPVIVTTGVVMTTFQSTGDAGAIMEGEINNGIMFKVASASEFLANLGLNETLTEYMSMVADRIFGVVWDSGIQILLFLAALQSISPSLYEASNVEGATAWETFWLITFPNVAPIILVNIVYTIVDTFSDTDNDVLLEIDSLINTTFNFGGAAAASWIFFLVILALIGIVFVVFKLLGGKND